MSNNKQSSIELFIEQLEEKGNAYEENEGGRTINISIDISDYMELKIQAKAMHKHEIRTAYCHGEFYQEEKLTDQYYNETFGDESNN